MLNFTVGTITLVVFLVVVAGMGVYFMKAAGPTTSARLNVYCLLRRGGWKEFLKGALVTTVALVVLWISWGWIATL